MGQRGYIERKLTLVQLETIASRLHDRWERQLEGGLTFGMDWPTVRLIFPVTYNVARRLRAAYLMRKAYNP